MPFIKEIKNIAFEVIKYFLLTLSLIIPISLIFYIYNIILKQE
jgi:hypothetical protein